MLAPARTPSRVSGRPSADPIACRAWRDCCWGHCCATWTRRRRRSGWRPTRPARSRCWGAPSRPSASRAPLRTGGGRGPRSGQRDPLRGPPRRRARWPEPGGELPPSADPDRRPGGRAEDRLRLLPGDDAARAALQPQQGRETSEGRGDRRPARLRAADAASRTRDEWPAPPVHDRRPGLRGRGRPADARVHPRAARHRRASRARRSPTSRSTRSLYREAWGEPVDALAALHGRPAMLFDDHDIHDDWNISQAWLEEMRAKPWWDDAHRRRAGRRTGSTSISAISRRTRSTRRGLLPRCRGRRRRPLLRDWAREADRGSEGGRWSYSPRPRRHAHRVHGLARGTRLRRDAAPHDRRRRVGLDRGARRAAAATTCCGRHAADAAVRRRCTTVEAWNEAVCDGAWGERWPRSSARSSGARSTWSTGRPSSTRSASSRTCSARSRRASAASRRPRS